MSDGLSEIAFEESSARERHELAFEEFTVRVEVEPKGEIWVSFHESGRCAFTISYGDLLHSLDFARKHGAQID